MGSTGFESTVCVCDSAASVVVEMCLNVTADNAPKSADEVVDLTWSRAAGS